MYQKIGEDISVLGIYLKGKFLPKKFKWGNQTLLINEVTLASDFKDGQVKKRHYSVLCGGNVYRICFNREEESWFLEEVWCE